MSITKDFKEFLGFQELTKQGGNFSPLLYTSSINFANKKFYSKYYSGDFGLFVIYTTGLEGESFFSMDKYKNCTEETFAKITRNLNELQNYKDFLNLQNSIYDLFEKYKHEQTQDQKVDDLVKSLILLNDTLSEILAATLFVEALDESFIERKLLETGSKLNTQDFIENSLKLTFESFESKMLKDINDFRDLKATLKELQWIFCDYFSVPKIDLVAEKIAEKINTTDFAKHISNVEKNISKNKLEIEAYKKLLNSEELKLFNFVQKSMEIRDTRKPYLLKILTMTFNFTTSILSNLNIDTELTPYSHIDDFKNGIYKEADYSEILLKRKQGVLACFYPESGFGSEYDDLENKLAELNKLLIQNKNVSEVFGKTASKGKVNGQVRIILSQKDFSKFENQDILVTSMTRPEFLPLMRKAKAIITDEGGITCHAAIISRELGIPCIIGTKIATKVLKDGDLVEVDADSGVVRVLEKSKYG